MFWGTWQSFFPTKLTHNADTKKRSGWLWKQPFWLHLIRCTGCQDQMFQKVWESYSVCLNVIKATSLPKDKTFFGIWDYCKQTQEKSDEPDGAIFWRFCWIRFIDFISDLGPPYLEQGYQRDGCYLRMQIGLRNLFGPVRGTTINESVHFSIPTCPVPFREKPSDLSSASLL